MPPRIFIDADACPVKDEVMRVAERHRLPVCFVSNRWVRGFDHPLVEKLVAPEGADAADDLIVERIQPGDITVTGDIRLAARCLERQALAIDNKGKPFDPASIGMAVAMRDLMAHLRDTGEIMPGGGGSFSKQDRSRFLDGLERVVQAARRGVLR